MDNPHTWSAFHKRWAQLKPPLRPNHEVALAFKEHLAQHDSHVLLLGVTPELANFGQMTTALERHPEMIKNIWPGDSPRARAICGDWLSHDFEGVNLNSRPKPLPHPRV